MINTEKFELLQYLSNIYEIRIVHHFNIFKIGNTFSIVQYLEHIEIVFQYVDISHFWYIISIFVIFHAYRNGLSIFQYFENIEIVFQSCDTSSILIYNFNIFSIS